MPRRIDQFFTNQGRNLLEASLTSGDGDDDDDLKPTFLVIVLILIGILLVSATIHFLLRYICRSTHVSQSTHIEQVVDVVDDDDVRAPPLGVFEIFSNSSSRRVDENNKKLIDSLPLFSFESVTGLKSSSASSADCAVCLSKFEPHDQLRLLPICCHAFHSDCIDMWLSSNTTCPLCRSTVDLAKSEDYLKLFTDLPSLSSSSAAAAGGGNDSFRIEIGSVSRRRISPVEEIDPWPRSYPMGSFEYVVDDEHAEVVVEPMYRGLSEFTIFGAKYEASAPPMPNSNPNPNPNTLPPGSEIAAEVGEERGWLKDYVDKLASSSSSLSRSFRFSGRFFTGSNRMSEGLSSRSDRRSVDIAVAGGDSRSGSWDLEGNRYGEEISNFFRWFSGV